MGGPSTTLQLQCLDSTDCDNIIVWTIGWLISHLNVTTSKTMRLQKSYEIAYKIMVLQGKQYLYVYGKKTFLLNTFLK